MLVNGFFLLQAVVLFLASFSVLPVLLLLVVLIVVSCLTVRLRVCLSARLCIKKMEVPGFDPGTCCMLSSHSTN